jgi:prepilin peptidase CpaA
MSHSTSATATATVPVSPRHPAPEDLGVDRAFLMQMAQVPVFALLFVAASWIGHQLWAAFGPSEIPFNCGPVVVICAGMILAAVIDGWAFKVPNWLTLSLVLSGWILGALHSLDVPIDAGKGGIGYALLGTLVGFALLFPMLAIGGMGQGDVKMQMGFGAWVGAYFGNGELLQGPGSVEIIFWAFAFGAITGGVFGLIMMAIRRQFHRNVSNFREIITDLQVLATMGPGKAAERANRRRSSWVRLPYGVPLCVGFLSYLYLKLNGMF